MLFVCWAVAGLVVKAQSYQGGLRGSIRDADGIVPGVVVTLTDEQTSISRTVATNDRGEYAFTAVEPGMYTVDAALQGYKAVTRGHLRIATQSFLVLDLTLEVGGIEENVIVTGEAPMIEHANASQGTVLDQAALETLPSPGRAAFLMGTSVPTFIFSSTTVLSRQQDQSNTSRVSIGGGPVRGNDYTFDGVSITDVQNRVVANPSIEALDDVKVQIHTYDAEVGRTGGGVFNVTLKSGANAFHGTAFLQTRPVWGSANNYFAQKALELCGTDASCISGNTKPDTVYYLPGAGFGGPLRKNRTLFWVSSEDYHDLMAMTISTTFPTAAERLGDFSGLTNQSGGEVIDLGLLGNSQRPNVVAGVDPGTSGSLTDRLASADHLTATWLNPNAFTTAVGTWGNAPRLLTDVRSPRLINTDVSVSKQVTFAGNRVVQVKLEVINLINRFQNLGYASTSFKSSTFGQINAQQGFMRMTQVMFRYSW